MTNVNNAKVCTRLIEKIKSLDEEKKAYRFKAINNWKKRKKLELLLKTARRERDTANTLLSETKQALQEFQDELQHKTKSREEMWTKDSESNTELEAMKQLFFSLKSQFEQKVSNLQTQLQSQFESDDALKQTRIKKNKKPRKAIDETSHKADTKDFTIKKLKNQKKVLLKEKKYLKKKIYQQAKMHQVRLAKYNISFASKRKKIDSLKHENARLSELQLKTKQALISDNDKSIKQLRETINTMKTKLNETERQVKDRKRLEREREVQESAVEMLSDDLDTINKEKTLLTLERNRLMRELDKFKNLYLHTPDIQETSRKNAGLSLKMLQL